MLRNLMSAISVALGAGIIAIYTSIWLDMTSYVSHKDVMKSKENFSLHEISTLSACPERRARFYIQMGLVDRPVGTGKGAHYTSRHLEQLLTVLRMKSTGLSLERIREFVHGQDEVTSAPKAQTPGEVNVWSRIYVSEGVELHIEPGSAGLTPEQIRSLMREVLAVYDRIHRREK